MKYIQTHLNIALPVIEIKKLSGLIVPQKSLAKLDERIRNAENTSPVNSDDTPIRPLPAGVSLEQAWYPTPLPKAFAEEAGPYVADAELDEIIRARDHVLLA